MSSANVKTHHTEIRVVSPWFVALHCVCLTISFANCPSPAMAQQPSTSPSPRARLTSSDEFYQSGSLQVIRLTVQDEDLRKMKAALPKRIYVPAKFRCGDETIENVGLRYKGNSSSHPRQQHKRSFLIKFDEYEDQHTFQGLKRVSLDNGIQFGSLFSEHLITEILRDLKIKSPRCNHAKLFLNGKYHGIYVNVERIDSAFIQRNFGEDGGALYKVDEGGPGANLAMLPADWERSADKKLGFEPKSSAAREDAVDVLDFIRTINKTPDDKFASVMERAMDIDAFLQTMSVMLFSGAFDQLTGWNPHNYYLYRQPQSERWYYLPWDLDVGFADNAFGKIPVISGWNAAWPIPGGPPRPLIERVVDDPRLLERYRRFADAILEKYFHPKVLIPKLDALYDSLKDELKHDPFPPRRATNPQDMDYGSIVSSMKEFMRRRYHAARALLDTPGTRPTFVPDPGAGRSMAPKPGAPSADAPSDLRVVSHVGSVVKLQWKDNATGEVAHIVQRASGETSDEYHNHIGEPGDNISSATDPRAEPGQTYHYRVYAIHPTANGPRGTGVSNTVIVK